MRKTLSKMLTDMRSKISIMLMMAGIALELIVFVSDCSQIEELRDEEADWTDYDVDEAAVKRQLTDTVFDLLINDTISCLNQIEGTRHSA